MTPEQLKQKPFEEIIKIGHEKPDTNEGESKKTKKNLLHPQKSQSKILSLTYLLKMKKSQIQHKHAMHDEDNSLGKANFKAAKS